MTNTRNLRETAWQAQREMVRAENHASAMWAHYGAGSAQHNAAMRDMRLADAAYETAFAAWARSEGSK